MPCSSTLCMSLDMCVGGWGRGRGEGIVVTSNPHLLICIYHDVATGSYRRQGQGGEGCVWRVLQEMAHPLISLSAIVALFMSQTMFSVVYFATSTINSFVI